MKKNFLHFSFIMIIALLIPLSAFAQGNSNEQSNVKIKGKIQSIGIVPLVSIELLNKTKLIGNIVRINSDDFIIKEAQSGVEQAISYKDVKQVKRIDKRGLSTAVKATIIVVSVLFVLSLIGNKGFGG